MITKAVVMKDGIDSYKGKRGRVRFRYLGCSDAIKPMEDRLLNTFTFSKYLEMEFQEHFKEDLT